MSKKVVFMAIFSIYLAVMAISAQEKATDFSGNWELDKAKSKLDERTRIESMTINVTQTDKELKIATTTKRGAPPEGANRGGGGRQGGGGFGGGDGTQTYSLDGKETKAQVGGGQFAGEATLKAKWEKSKLKLTSSRNFETPNGAISISTKEVWLLSEDGKTLTIKRDMETPRGTNSSEMVFTKQ